MLYELCPKLIFVWTVACCSAEPGNTKIPFSHSNPELHFYIKNMLWWCYGSSITSRSRWCLDSCETWYIPGSKLPVISWCGGDHTVWWGRQPTGLTVITGANCCLPLDETEYALQGVGSWITPLIARFSWLPFLMCCSGGLVGFNVGLKAAHEQSPWPSLLESPHCALAWPGQAALKLH